MLQLKNITKNYLSGDNEVQALKGIDIEFRENEFVSILGQSGCGKTTLLNIIGGLDRYTSGNLIINGKSTKEFKDKDWDTYRNHSVGFVFQSYNLIPHQTVLANVELALTISGVGKAERRKRAIEALQKVGLGDQINKKPNQMSGGQMQRVAIARALVNDPDILLADEPTGALDSKTSVQVMEILKEISKDRLIIMVTHNPELAEKYSSRIVRLLDGKITDDSNPYKSSEEDVKKAKNKKDKSGKASMKFTTAVRLSLNNLMTKKGRTFLTSFAGSIGIIGIALILSLSNGMQSYINRVEEDTLSSYPLTIQEASIDVTSMLEAMMGNGEKEETVEETTENINSKKIFKESDLYIGQNISGIYTITKFEAEKIVLKAIKSGLNAQILRMGNITNRYSDGVFQQNVEENAFAKRLKSFIELGMFPKYLLDHAIELGPVDLCAEAVIKILEYDSNCNVLHIYNSKLLPIKLLVNTMKELGINIEAVDDETMSRKLKEILNDNFKKEILSGIIHDIDSKKRLIYTSNIRVSYDFSEKYLEKIGFSWKNIDREYILKYMNYFKGIGFIEY